ncbi:photosynthetic NDH subunit of lumenal location 4, chloroplastic-like isoform X1 [Zingiber officinale]|uniref:photosynthetic NDH subunit of lumenal location 4, chloroplastic-like isoform X1 n=1 Tax=Zingiber officinale TaxID=94328 RepID=UPI001C4BBB83|nr:photosynthetic NDH subunit of lumenal location 4, chloroplastic-like isoform X1 [Zingiber officinale]
MFTISTLSVTPSSPRFLSLPPRCHKVTPFLSERGPISVPPPSPLPIGDSRVEAAAASAPSLSSSSSYAESVPSTSRRLVGAGMCLLLMSSFADDANATRIQYFATVGEPLCDMNFARSGLGFCDVAVGTGAVAPRSELINVHYTARFADGTVFDSSYKRGRPLTMRIGAGKVLPGLDQGILGGGGVPPMHVGGKRKLLIPPLLAYGPEPAGCFQGDCNIPANATLLYDIFFVGIYK